VETAGPGEEEEEVEAAEVATGVEPDVDDDDDDDDEAAVDSDEVEREEEEDESFEPGADCSSAHGGRSSHQFGKGLSNVGLHRCSYMICRHEKGRRLLLLFLLLLDDGFNEVVAVAVPKFVDVSVSLAPVA